jgi:tetratricopeptide (TPR) repeat protein
MATRRYEEGFDALRRAEQLPGHEGNKLVGLGYAYALTGKRQEAEAILTRIDSLASTQDFRPTERAVLELALGHRDRALERLERAERERDLDFVPLQLNERLDPLRSDPRFRRIVERMGLPEAGRRGGE